MPTTDSSGYIWVYAREQFEDLFHSHITTAGQFLSQLQCTGPAKCLFWIWDAA